MINQKTAILIGLGILIAFWSFMSYSSFSLDLGDGFTYISLGVALLGVIIFIGKLNENSHKIVPLHRKEWSENNQYESSKGIVESSLLFGLFGGITLIIIGGYFFVTKASFNLSFIFFLGLYATFASGMILEVGIGNKTRRSKISSGIIFGIIFLIGIGLVNFYVGNFFS